MENEIVKIIVNFLMNGSITIMAVIVGYFIAKNKYVFQKTYDQKSILITELYIQIVRLEFELKKYIHFIGADMSDKSIEEKI